jgi:transcriptional regulator GlxA family with amidase domain
MTRGRGQRSGRRDDIRFEIAQQMLEDSAMEIIQIAVLLGYASASAFTRAFRRWSGTTPAHWRATAQGVD